ncbi:DUF58 domain-containing protein [Thalassorhabdus alkalitolerans]|uniref:DUF58 domain-containing protein n=1 Tax=Thalassorhabdus alkalitolerans TaxID=2282697 RepID=A0ABW0YN05_9BACI
MEEKGRQAVKAMKFFFLLLLLAGLYAYAMFQGGFVSWFLFYSAVSLVGINLLFVLFPWRMVEVKRSIETTTLPSEGICEVTLTVTKKAPFPLLYFAVKDNVPEGLQGTGKPAGMVFFFPIGKTFTYSYEVKGVQRGEYVFSSIDLQAGDMFGFFKRQRRAEEKTTLLVYPSIHPLRNWKTHMEKDAETEAISTKVLQEALSVAGVRDYVPGDRMTSIDWKISARAGKLVTKEFEAQEGKGYTLFFDPFQKTKDHTSFELAIEFSASLADFCLKKGIPLGFLLMQVDKEKLEKASSKAHFKEVFEELSKASPQLHSSVLHSPPSLEKKDGVVYVVTDVNEKVKDHIQQLLYQRREVIVIFVNTRSFDDKSGELKILDNIKLQGAQVFHVKDYQFNIDAS